MIKRLCVAAMAAVMLAGCAGGLVTVSEKPGVCDAIPEGGYSLICEAAAAANTTPEAAAAVLKLANVGMLSSEVYATDEALQFVADIVEFVIKLREIGASPDALLAYAIEKYGLLPAKAQVAFIIMEDFGAQFATVSLDQATGEVRLLSDYDLDLILRHLQKQKLVITLMAQ